jgi:hypothetical protein
MTTGRINQVTILKPGVANDARGRRRVFQVTGRAPREKLIDRPRQTAPCSASAWTPDLPLGASCFPLSVPQGPVGTEYQEYHSGRPHVGASGGDLCPALPAPKRGQRQDGDSCCSAIWCSQRPTTHRTHPGALKRRAFST